MNSAGSRSRLARTFAWGLDVATTAPAWLVVWAILAAFGLFNAPGDFGDRDLARRAATSEWSEVPVDVEVYVDYEHAKGGGWHEVDQVRVMLADSSRWHELDAVANEDTLTDEHGWNEGWQDATDETGYTMPLTVKVIPGPDGEPEAMVAARDIEYWVEENYDPEIDLVIGTGSIVIGIGGAMAWTSWTRRGTASPGRTYPGATRAERRAARERDAQWARANRKRKRRR